MSIRVGISLIAGETASGLSSNANDAAFTICFSATLLYRLDASVRAGFVEQSDPQQLDCVVGICSHRLILTNIHLTSLCKIRTFEANGEVTNYKLQFEAKITKDVTLKQYLVLNLKF